MYRIRFFFIMLKGLLGRKKSILTEFDLYFIAIPFIDTDFSRLFTHAYSAMTALGRWHFVFSSEFKTAALKNKWLPVTTAETMTYHRSIKAFQRIKMTTKLICWDERRFFLQQTFFVNSDVYAVGYTEGLLRSPSGHLKPPEVFKTFGVNIPSPAMPNQISAWYLSRRCESHL